MNVGARITVTVLGAIAIPLECYGAPAACAKPDASKYCYVDLKGCAICIAPAERHLTPHGTAPGPEPGGGSNYRVRVGDLAKILQGMNDVVVVPMGGTNPTVAPQTQAVRSSGR